MMDADCNHCWHQTGVFAPTIAPRSWCEFKCCHCGTVRKAENYSLLRDNHGPHVIVTKNSGNWVIS